MVVWTDGAQFDLKKIHDYIADNSPDKAKEITQEIFNKAQMLVEYPYMGRKSPIYEVIETREVFVYAYRILYKIQNNQIFILGVHHGSRDLKNLDIPID